MPSNTAAAEPLPGVLEVAAVAASVNGLEEEKTKVFSCPSDTANSTCEAARDTKQNALLAMLLLLCHTDDASDVARALTDTDMSKDAMGAPIIVTSDAPVQGKAVPRV